MKLEEIQPDPADAHKIWCPADRHLQSVAFIRQPNEVCHVTLEPDHTDLDLNTIMGCFEVYHLFLTFILVALPSNLFYFGCNLIQATGSFGLNGLNDYAESVSFDFIHYVCILKGVGDVLLASAASHEALQDILKEFIGLRAALY